MDLSAKTFVNAVSPSSAQSILKKVKKALEVSSSNHSTFKLDDLDGPLSDSDLDDSEEVEVLEEVVDIADSIGKALHLIKQVCP